MARRCASSSSATAGEPRDHRALGLELRREHHAVRLVHLARSERRAGRSELRAGRQDRNARSPRADHLGHARRGERADLARAEPRAGGDDGTARRDVPTDGSDVGSRGNAAPDRDCVVLSTTASCWIDRVGAVGHDTARRDPHRLPGRERPARPASLPRSGRRRAASPACPPSAGHSRPSPSSGNGGRSTTSDGVSASTRPAASSSGTRSASSGRARSSTSACAASRVRSSSTSGIRYRVVDSVIAGRYRLERADRQRRHVGGLGGDGPRARPDAWPSSCSPPTPTPPASSARRGRQRRSRTPTSARSTTTAWPTGGGSWCSSTCPAARSRTGCATASRSPDDETAPDRRRDRGRARARPRARGRPPRPEAGEHPLRRGGTREDRRLRHRAHGRSDRT